MPGIAFSYAGMDRFATVAKLHSHRGFELLYIDSGACEITFDGRETMTGKPGDVFLIPPHLEHERLNLGECQTFFAVFEKELPGPAQGAQKFTAKGDAILPRLFQLLPELNRDYDQGQSSLLVELILQRLAWYDRQQKRKALLHPALQKAGDFMERHFDRDLSNEEIADAAAVSVSHLFLLFRSAFGVSPQRYLLALRMAAARQMLLNPLNNVSDVAAQTGFCNLFYFSRCFKRYHGVSPSVYRQDPARFADTESFGRIVPRDQTAPDADRRYLLKRT